MTDAVKKRTDAQAVLSSDKSDDLKLLEVFQIYKDDLRNKYTELYYALLGWKHSHWTELLKDKKDCPKDVAAVGTNGKERHNANEI